MARVVVVINGIVAVCESVSIALYLRAPIPKRASVTIVVATSSAAAAALETAVDRNPETAVISALTALERNAEAEVISALNELSTIDTGVAMTLERNAEAEVISALSALSMLVTARALERKPVAEEISEIKALSMLDRGVATAVERNPETAVRSAPTELVRPATTEVASAVNALSRLERREDGNPVAEFPRRAETREPTSLVTAAASEEMMDVALPRSELRPLVMAEMAELRELASAVAPALRALARLDSAAERAVAAAEISEAISEVTLATVWFTAPVMLAMTGVTAAAALMELNGTVLNNPPLLRTTPAFARLTISPSIVRGAPPTTRVLIALVIWARAPEATVVTNGTSAVSAPAASSITV